MKFHDKYYKLLLLIPLSLLISSFIYMGSFYSKNHDFINKDISLTGGTSITIYDENINPADLTNAISNRLESVNVREVSDTITRQQIAVIVETKSDGCNESETEQIKKVLGDYLGYQLIEGENSNVECTGSTLSDDFYQQLIYAIILGFSFMGAVVFFIFNKNNKLRVFVWLIILISPTLFLLFKLIDLNSAIIISLISLVVNLYFYIRYSIPSVAVISCAFADIFLTLTLVNLLGLQISTAGIVAFLMLIGYSVDTDILLTTKALKREEGSLNKRIFDSFKTGITMTLTSLLVVIIALIIVGPFSQILSQIFTIMSIGLMFDIFNTWITNVSIIKWYVLRKQNKNEAAK